MFYVNVRGQMYCEEATIGTWTSLNKSFGGGWKFNNSDNQTIYLTDNGIRTKDDDNPANWTDIIKWIKAFASQGEVDQNNNIKCTFNGWSPNPSGGVQFYHMISGPQIVRISGTGITIYDPEKKKNIYNSPWTTLLQKV